MGARAPAPRAVHAEQSESDRLAGAARRALGYRLSAAEVADLRDLWCYLPGDVGLSSSTGAQIARLLQSLRREAEPETVTPDAPADAPADDLADRAAAALTAWRAAVPAHVALDVPPPEPPAARIRLALAVRGRGPRFWNPRDGLHYGERAGDVRAARGTAAQTIHCAAAGVGSGCCRMVTVTYRDEAGVAATELVTAPLTLERWVDTRHPGSERVGRTARHVRLRAAWRALARMTADGNGDWVAVLYAVHSGDLPPSDLAPVLGDLAHVAPDTAAVRAHAEALTRRLRAGLGAARVPARAVRYCRLPHGPECDPGPHVTSESWTPSSVRHLHRRETVTAAAAARDLLLERPGETPERAADRRSAVLAVRQQAEEILQAAGLAYRAARRAPEALS